MFELVHILFCGVYSFNDMASRCFKQTQQAAAANAMSEKPPKELFKNVVQGNGKCKHVCLYIHYIRYYILVCGTFM